MFGLHDPFLPIVIAFTAKAKPGCADFILFTAFASLAGLLASSALGATAATTQDLVLPRKRGTATATFFLSTTLVGLALGPYMAGQVSAITHSLSTGVLSTLAVKPFGLIELIIAYRRFPAAAPRHIDPPPPPGETSDGRGAGQKVNS